jgi:hypothetical protein
VDLLLSLSSSIAWLLGGPAGKPPWPGLDEEPGLIVPELMFEARIQDETNYVSRVEDGAVYLKNRKSSGRRSAIIE